MNNPLQFLCLQNCVIEGYQEEIVKLCDIWEEMGENA